MENYQQFERKIDKSTFRSILTVSTLVNMATLVETFKLLSVLNGDTVQVRYVYIYCYRFVKNRLKMILL